MSEIQEIEISALNHFVYCPKRAWLCYISQEFIENEYTIEGRSFHTRVDSGVVTKRRDLYQIRSAWLRSEKYGLVGKADLIEDINGKIYPVEYKRGKIRDWKNDQVQLMAQALCIEEMLKLNERIEKGFVYYHLSNTRQEVDLNNELRDYTKKVIMEFRNLFIRNIKPDIEFNQKCPNCSMNQVCLPKETEKLRNLNIDNIFGG